GGDAADTGSIGDRWRRKGAAGDHVGRGDGDDRLTPDHHLGAHRGALPLATVHAGDRAAHVHDWSWHHITCRAPLLTSTIAPVTLSCPLALTSSCGPPSSVAPAPPFRSSLFWASSVMPCCADSLRFPWDSSVMSCWLSTWTLPCDEILISELVSLIEFLSLPSLLMKA